MITSKDNPNFKKWVKLSQKKYRQKEKLFLAEGEHLAVEAKKAGVLVEVLVCEGTVVEIDAPVTYLASHLFGKVSASVTPAGIVAVCRMKETKAAANNRLLLVDGVQDPGNLGTLVRSALAFGYDGIILSEDTVDIYNEKVVRATQGAVFEVPFQRGDLLEAIGKLKNDGVFVYSTALNCQSITIDDVPAAEKMAFIVGNEGSGVRQELIDSSDGAVIIPMSGLAESLNVGVAGSILMHQFNGLGKS